MVTQPGISSDSFQNQQPAMNNYEDAVFVSYAWEGESERAVDALERAFAERGIHIMRDKKDLGYKGSIEAFEQRIGQGQCVVLVISDKYLRSEHCMCELVEVDKNRRLRERIFPIVLADARIYRAKDRLIYIKHWDEQIEQLNQAIKQVDVVANLGGITTDLDKYARIRANFDHLTDLLSDMNALTPEMHAANGFSTLISAVERAMAGKQTGSQSGEGTTQLDEISDNRSEQLLKREVLRYKTGLARRLEEEAADLKGSLHVENYIANYIELDASPGPSWESGPRRVEEKKRQKLFDLLGGSRQKRVLVVGEAGSGKTAALKRYAWELAQENSAAIPILVKLRSLGREKMAATVIDELKRDGAFAFIANEQELEEKLRTMSNVHFLFDGLNEISSAPDSLIKELRDFLNCFPIASVIIMCRSQNDLLVRELTDKMRHLVLLPLNAKQIARHLGGISYDEFSNPARIHEMSRNPFLLTLIKNLIGGDTTKFANPSQVLTRFVKLVLDKDRENNIGQDVDDETKRQALAYLAFSLHQQSQTAINRDYAVKILEQKFQGELPERIIKSVVSHGFVLEKDGAVQFSPNLMMQEYFAALELRETVIKEFRDPVTPKDFLEHMAALKTSNASLDERVKIAKQYLMKNLRLKSSALKPLARNPWWTETFILLAGLVADPEKPGSTSSLSDWLIGHLAFSWGVPWLAWWCIGQGIRVRLNFRAKFPHSPKRPIGNFARNSRVSKMGEQFG
jgi:hypothetical protein